MPARLISFKPLPQPFRTAYDRQGDCVSEILRALTCDQPEPTPGCRADGMDGPDAQRADDRLRD